MPSSRGKAASETEAQKRRRASTTGEGGEASSAAQRPPSTPAQRLRLIPPTPSREYTPSTPSLRLNPPRARSPIARGQRRSAPANMPPPKAPAQRAAPRPGVQTRRTAQEALQLMDEDRDDIEAVPYVSQMTQPPPEPPESSPIYPVGFLTDSEMVAFQQRQENYDRHRTPIFLGTPPERQKQTKARVPAMPTFDDDLIVNEEDEGIENTDKHSQHTKADKPQAGPSTREDPVMYTLYMTFLVDKVPRVHDEVRITAHTQTYALYSHEALALQEEEFLDHIHEAKQAATEWSLRKSISLSPPEIQACVKYKRQTAADKRWFNIYTFASYTVVVKELRRLHEQKKADLEIDICFKYCRLQAPPSSQQAAPLSQDLTTGGHIGGRGTVAPAAAPQRASATQRQLQQVEAENVLNPSQQGVEDLGVKWACTLTSCKNTGRICYFSSTAPRSHYPLEASDLAKWHLAIINDTSGRIDDKKPPPLLLTDLLKVDRASKKQQRGSTTSQSDTTSNAPISEANRSSNTHTAQNFYINTGGAGDSGVASIQRDIKALTDQISRQQRASTSYRAQSSTPAVYTPYNPPSSPVASTLHADVNDFISWMIQEFPAQEAEFYCARDLLLDHQVTISVIQCTKRPLEWDDYGVARGIGSLLTKNVKRWERTLYSTPSPPQAAVLPVRPSPHKDKGKGHVIESIERPLDSQAFIETQDDEEYPTQNDSLLEYEKDLDEVN